MATIGDLKRWWYGRLFFKAQKRLRNLGTHPAVILNNHKANIELVHEENDVSDNDGRCYDPDTYVGANIYLGDISNPIRLTMDDVKDVEAEEIEDGDGSLPDDVNLIFSSDAKQFVERNKRKQFEEAGASAGLGIGLKYVIYAAVIGLIGYVIFTGVM